MRLNKLEKRLLTDLFKSTEGLFIFTLYRRYNLSPKELFLAINKLKENRLIEIDDDRISITKQGIQFAVNSNFSKSNKSDRFSKIPENFIGPNISINEFYIPKFNSFKD